MTLEEKLKQIEVAERDVNAVKQLVSQLSSVFNMMSGTAKAQLQNMGMDMMPTVHYCDETREQNAVVIGLKLVFPDKKTSDYFMACILKGLGE